MTRIIAGVAGSLKLTSPAKTTRPTSDRVRESIFNRLDSRDLVAGTHVLDLYAGTGALAFESLSRGAATAELVENNKAAAGVCIKNGHAVVNSIQKGGSDAEFRVHIMPVKTFLTSAAAGKKFELVFIDPPYDVSNADLIHNLEDLVDALAEEFTIVVERSSRSDEPLWPSQYKLELRKDYGDTSVFWLSPQN